jgi:hypothetical protein
MFTDFLRWVTLENLQTNLGRLVMITDMGHPFSQPFLEKCDIDISHIGNLNIEN